MIPRELRNKLQKHPQLHVTSAQLLSEFCISFETTQASKLIPNPTPNSRLSRSSPQIVPPFMPAAQQQIEMVTRDRGGAYALAAARALPDAMQVADRRHLMENASQAFQAATRSSMRQIREALGGAIIDPALLTAAEKLQYEGYLRREDVNDAVT